jgi:hypothetical protein
MSQFSLPESAVVSSSAPEISLTKEKKILWTGATFFMDGGADYNSIIYLDLDRDNSTESSPESPGPFNNGSSSYFLEFLIGASELAPFVGSSPRKLCEIGVFCVNAPNQFLPNFRVDIQNTSLTTLENQNVTLQNDPFFIERNIKPKSNSWFFFKSSEGSYFQWDGVSNIYVSFCWSGIFLTPENSGTHLRVSQNLQDIHRMNVLSLNSFSSACLERSSPQKIWGEPRPSVLLKWFSNS